MIIKKYLCECPICGAKIMAKGKIINGELKIDDKCPKDLCNLIRVFDNSNVSTSMATSEDSRYFEEQILHSNPAIMKRDPLEESDFGIGIQKSNRRV